MSDSPLSDRERRILDYLRTVDKSGYNELFQALAEHANRRNLRTSLDRLIKMGLVHGSKLRHGKRDIYIIEENLTKFRVHSLRLLAEWGLIRQQMQQMDQIVKNNELSAETQGFFLDIIICRAALATERIALIDEKRLPEKMKRGLLSYSKKEFHMLLDEVAELGKQNPSVIDGFEVASLKLLRFKIPEEVKRSLWKLDGPRNKDR